MDQYNTDSSLTIETCKLGVRVKLQPHIFCEPSIYNPEIGSLYECEGIIEDIEYSLIAGTISFTRVLVKWDNGVSNLYSMIDLKLSNANEMKFLSIW